MDEETWIARLRETGENQSLSPQGSCGNTIASLHQSFVDSFGEGARGLARGETYLSIEFWRWWRDNCVKKIYFTICWWPISWDEMFGADSLVTITSNSHVRNIDSAGRNAKGKRSWQLNVGLYFSTENVCASVVQRKYSPRVFFYTFPPLPQTCTLK